LKNLRLQWIVNALTTIPLIENPYTAADKAANMLARECLMGEAKHSNRPLSPHLTVYRPQLAMVTSILTRITGISLLAGALLAVAWFLAAATSPEYFETIDRLMTSVLGDLVMTASLWALWYHTLAGVRHLIWDNLHGLDLPTAQVLGWSVVIGSVILTILTVLVV
jgi:succinate dehydrogenase / fumarate reductase cytochrome b subunit